jgi:hypothetical protein
LNSADRTAAPASAEPVVGLATDEPRIEGAALAAGHDGFPELVLRIRFENGAVTDVIVDNAAGIRLMARCGAERIEALVGHSWREVRNALLEE